MEEGKNREQSWKQSAAWLDECRVTWIDLRQTVRWMDRWIECMAPWMRDVWKRGRGDGRGGNVPGAPREKERWKSKWVKMDHFKAEHVHSHTQTHSHTYTLTHRHIHTHMHTHAHTHTHTHACTHRRTQIDKHTRAHTHTHTHTHLTW